ncbi:30S ribosomal protein THX [Marivirga sp. S37H4]|uniref:30S ribosomal protein THX n=1 Tax=Marivirga aurantiaca TaxID=2802615 RepID=A0A935C970_9BACT|nr:30S ribosomal protein THX [Marivirga aurantiaca]MBK6265407.1 30S ribosomal protein THX [Marivirga aurantiaca]
MGKGDRKTKKGKISMGSYGVLRPKKSNEPTAIEPTKKAEKKPKAEPKAAATKSTKKK